MNGLCSAMGSINGSTAMLFSPRTVDEMVTVLAVMGLRSGRVCCGHID